MNENLLREEENIEIDLLELIYMLLQKWWLIFIAGVVGAVAMMAVTAFLLSPQYESQSMLYILNKTTSVTSMADLQIGTELTEDFIVIATSKPVIDGAIEKIQEEESITFTRKEVLDMLEITNAEDTRILVIKATNENPMYACMVANAVAEETCEQMAAIMKSDPPTTVERAEVAEKPVSPSLLKNTVLGGLIAVVLVCLVLMVQYMLNDTIKTEEQVTKYLDAPTLAVIPFVKVKEHKREEVKRLKKVKHEK